MGVGAVHSRPVTLVQVYTVGQRLLPSDAVTLLLPVKLSRVTLYWYGYVGISTVTLRWRPVTIVPRNCVRWHHSVRQCCNMAEVGPLVVGGEW
jgi:hypothetical protein